MKWAFQWKGFIVPLALVVIAQSAAVIYGIHSDSLASPWAILRAAGALLIDGTLLAMMRQTLLAALGGLLLGGGTGLVCAIVLGLSPSLSRLFRYPIEVLRPIPAIAVLPIFLMIYGFGYRMEIAIIAFACFWPNLIIGQAAVASVEPRLLEVSRVLGLGFGARVIKIVIPAALPRLFLALRLAAGVALIVAVTVEIAMNPQGMGYELMSAQSSLRPDAMFAILLYIGLLGWALNAILVFAQHRLFGVAAAAPPP